MVSVNNDIPQGFQPTRGWSIVSDCNIQQDWRLGFDSPSLNSQQTRLQRQRQLRRSPEHQSMARRYPLEPWILVMCFGVKFPFKRRRSGPSCVIATKVCHFYILLSYTKLKLQTCDSRKVRNWPLKHVYNAFLVGQRPQRCGCSRYWGAWNQQYLCSGRTHWHHTNSTSGC